MFAKQMSVCLSNILNSAWQACLSVWPPRQALLEKHKHFCLSEAKNVCQTRVCVVAQPANIVHDKQNFKCLPNNVCPFGRGFRCTIKIFVGGGGAGW